jgi:LysM repeat protein
MHGDSSVHIVRKGDTLSAISKKYSVPVDELKEINNLRSAKLKIGQQIIVKQIVKQYEAKNYTVRKGDTIWSIARKYDLDPDELMEINSLETDALHIGQKILLKAETETKEQKTYEAILSQSPDEHEMEKVTASEEISKIGTQDRLILFAKKLLDIPYRFGGNSLLGIDPIVPEDRTIHSPLRNRYVCKDGKSIICTHHPEEKYWPQFCEASEHEHWLTDPRFADTDGRRTHLAELIELLDEIFKTRTSEEWMKIFVARGLMFCPVQKVTEIHIAAAAA